MNCYPQSLERLMEVLAKLPGVGPKTAQRLAFFILEQGKTGATELSDALLDVAAKITTCPVCFNIAEEGHCALCDDLSRDDTVLCVVESARDIIPIEKSGSFKGRYHVLGGLISPMEGIGPKELHVRELLKRMEDGVVKEVIMATGANVEGEATAVYLADLLKPLVPKITRIAQGMPVGGDLEYIDEITLAKALSGRREF
jgi:recombination protein RecR